MLFGVDWDGTWAAAPALFAELRDLIRLHGHEVLVATNRGPGQPIGAAVDAHVVYCAGRPKRAACLAAGHRVDVWVDDNPVLVDFGQAGLDRLARG